MNGFSPAACMPMQTRSLRQTTTAARDVWRLRFAASVLLVMFTVLALVGAQASATEARPRPNVLLILVDDLKPSLGAYGDRWAHSPNLDRLAASGMRFNRAYCNQAVCAPSRNNLLIGSRSTSIGIYSLGDHFRKAVPNAVTMPQYFKQHGYHSAGIGKVFHIGHGNINDVHSWSVPFQPDNVIDYVLPESTHGQLTREQALFSNLPANGLPRGAAWERADVYDDAYADGRIASEGIRRLQQYQASDQPFFLALGFTKPHLPFCAPQKYWELYNPDDLPLPQVISPPEGAPEWAGKTLGELNQYEPVPENPPLDESLIRTLIHGYYASLSYMDSQVGRVLDELQRLELAGNTIVVLWGDHGYHLGDHGMWTKHTNYEQACRIPIVISAPGVTRPGSVSSELVETVDLFPTVAELAGLPIPEGPQPIDGESLVGILTGESQRPTGDSQTVTNAASDGIESGGHAYHCYPRGDRIGKAVRTSRYRLVMWSRFEDEAAVTQSDSGPSVVPDNLTYELYDYETDPLEARNLADSRPDVVSRLGRLLASHPPAMPPIGWTPPAATSPQVADVDLTIEVLAMANKPHGVLLAQGGREHGYALHLINGRPAFDVRVHGRVSRVVADAVVNGEFRLQAILNREEMTLSVNGGQPVSTSSPGRIPVQPKDPLSVGHDALTAAGDYEAPNRFYGRVVSWRVIPGNR